MQTDYMDQYLQKAVIENKALFVNTNATVSLVASNSLSDGGGEDKFVVLPVGLSLQRSLEAMKPSVPDMSTWPGVPCRRRRVVARLPKLSVNEHHNNRRRRGQHNSALPHLSRLTRE